MGGYHTYQIGLKRDVRFVNLPIYLYICSLSSMAEQSAVNRQVVGSKPTVSARLVQHNCNDSRGLELYPFP